MWKPVELNKSATASGDKILHTCAEAARSDP